ncbi:hypothetical protein FPCIR_8311 [Fusarium pseudocircinatum]|uniref:Transcription factor domain-containing protein n=1 Tax=Fusarium pseudocircinatum TaxID=56676 RepID=A0A8H5L328_9HYPO|nr:hypothetical protein FPCIR_8311 [Fusarium pseudocircinatum]
MSLESNRQMSTELPTRSLAGRPPTACRQCKARKVSARDSFYSFSFLLIKGSMLPPNRGTSSKCIQASEGRADLAADRQTRIRNSPDMRSNVLPLAFSFGIPEPLLMKLVDLFFSHAYNATLLLHPTSFRKALLAGRVREDIVLSICAFASVFYDDGSNRNTLKEQGFTAQWAERASEGVITHLEYPSEDNVVTFVILALVWYSCGSWRRSNMHRAYTLPAQTRECNANRTCDWTWRRYGACYLMNCHATSSAFIVKPIDSSGKLPFPVSEDSFLAAVDESAVFNKASNRRGIHAELIQVMWFWYSVNATAKFDEVESDQRYSATHSLEGQISRWWAGLPDSYKLDQRSCEKTSDMGMRLLTLVRILYHQCLCVLHGSVVPLFCWGSESLVGPATKTDLGATGAGACLQHSRDASHDIPSEGADRSTPKFCCLCILLFSCNTVSVGEPKYMDVTLLDGLSMVVRPARTSILTHTGVLWKEYGIASDGEDFNGAELLSDSVISRRNKQDNSYNPPSGDVSTGKNQLNSTDVEGNWPEAISYPEGETFNPNFISIESGERFEEMEGPDLFSSSLYNIFGPWEGVNIFG